MIFNLFLCLWNKYIVNIRKVDKHSLNKTKQLSDHTGLYLAVMI